MKVSIPSMGIRRVEVTPGSTGHLKESMRIRLGLKS